ncbi:MAG: hypothetical protein ACI9VN_001750, partial [Patescibacteria group bacterium]
TSGDVDGPGVDWIDISTIGTEVSGLADDNSAAFVPMGMDFHYYWSDYDQMKIGSNGWLSFDNVSNISHCFPAVPTPGGNGDNLVCPLMGDLNFTGVGNPGKVYYHNDGAGKFIVSYHDAPFWVNANPAYIGSNTFQAVFDSADSSITFNYATMDLVLANDIAGCFTDVVVGMENITGDIGLNVINDAFPPSNSATKFYYPSVVTFSVQDLGPSWNQNVENGAEFYLPYDNVLFTAKVANTGNTDITSETTVDLELINQFTGIDAHSSEQTIATLTSGASSDITFDAASNLEPGQYFVNVSTDNSDDINPGNDGNSTELIVLDTTGSQLVFTYAVDAAPSGSISWGTGGGAGVYMKPPQYPTDIEAVEVFVASNAANDEFVIEILDDNGPNGGPGDILATQTIGANDYVANDWVTVFFDAGVSIPDGGFYVGWQEGSTGGDIALATQTEGPFSRRTFEILSNEWAEYRMNLTTEALIRVLAVNNYMIPTATNDPLLDANVNVFPNPVKNVLTIENKSVLTLEDVYIYNTLGEVVLQEELSVNVGDDATINLQGLTNGIYFVKMKADNSWLSRKITVVK